MNTTARPMTIDHPMKGTNVMLLEEALARSRMHEAEQAAQEYRQARRLAAAHTWQRLARWAACRAARANDVL
jgi:hypothetical protein